MNIDLATILNKYKDQKPKKNSGDIIWERSYPVSAVISIVDEYVEQFKPKWISVLDAVPTNDKEYLFSNKWGNIFVGQYLEGLWFIDGDTTSYIKKVTHWMTLPDAP